MKRFLVILISVFCLAGCCKDRIKPEYSIDFKLNKKTTLTNYYVYGLRGEHLAFVSTKCKKNKVCVFSSSEMFYNKMEISGSFVMVDVYKFLEVETNEEKMVPLLIRNDDKLEENKALWQELKDKKPYYQNLY